MPPPAGRFFFLYFENPLQSHVKSEELCETLQNFNCSKCEKSFGTKLLLNKHVKSHKIVEKAACSQCSKSFPRQILESHKEQLHNKILTCDKCGKVCRGSVRLYNHKYRVHHGKTYSCTICGKSFASKISLERHVDVMHKKLSMYKCDLCVKELRCKLNDLFFGKLIQNLVKLNKSVTRIVFFGVCRAIASRAKNLVTTSFPDRRTKRRARLRQPGNGGSSSASRTEIARPPFTR